MAEFTKNEVQTVLPNQVVTLNTTIGCNKGYVYHRNGSGIVTLRGITPNCFARYQVTFNGNIAVPSTGTLGPISVAVSIDGEPILTSRAIVTPAAVATEPPTQENFFNVTSTAIVNVPRGCCFNVSVENTSEGATPADPAPAILVQNANLVVSRIA
ncbi:MAG: hypothetical protein IKH28_03035 [Lachnospiraceae bacterium]|nr:hypothetical protein [Lachnospiraceae bacterium]